MCQCLHATRHRFMTYVRTLIPNQVDYTNQGRVIDSHGELRDDERGRIALRPLRPFQLIAVLLPNWYDPPANT